MKVINYSNGNSKFEPFPYTKISILVLFGTIVMKLISAGHHH